MAERKELAERLREIADLLVSEGQPVRLGEIVAKKKLLALVAKIEGEKHEKTR
jgi:hypothetical protein